MAQLPITRLASEMAARAEPKKKRGILDKVGGFFADAGQEVGRMVTNPIETAQRFGAEAKQNFYDPIRNLPKAFDPTVDMTPLNRVNTGLAGGLAVADLLTPFVPEGTLANSLAKRATEEVAAKTASTANRSVGPTAADLFYAKYGVHGSPTQGITQIEPRMGSNAFPNDAVTFAQPLPNANYDLANAVKTVSRYAGQDKPSSIYIAKYPRGFQTKQYNDFIVSDVPGRVVGEYQLPTAAYGTPEYKMRNEMLETTVPEYLLSALLSDVKSPALRKKLVANFGIQERDRLAKQAAIEASYATQPGQVSR